MMTSRPKRKRKRRAKRILIAEKEKDLSIDEKVTVQ
jgi:hypothetical protein